MKFIERADLDSFNKKAHKKGIMLLPANSPIFWEAVDWEECDFVKMFDCRIEDACKIQEDFLLFIADSEKMFMSVFDALVAFQKTY